MVSGEFPFVKNESQIIQRILNGKPDYLKTFSSELTDLLPQILRKEPDKRIPLSTIKSHPWFSDFEYNNLLIFILNYHSWSMVDIDQKIVEQIQSLGIDCSDLKHNLSIRKLENDAIAYRMIFKEKITKIFQCLNQSAEFVTIRMGQPINQISKE
jgi:serine/threonine protein kinase